MPLILIKIYYYFLTFNNDDVLIVVRMVKFKEVVIIMVSTLARSRYGLVYLSYL